MATVEGMKTLKPCPHCGKTLRRAGALTMHARFCAKNPEAARGGNSLDIHQRREEVLELHIRGARIKQIAENLGVSSGAVCADIKAILEETRRSLDLTPMIERVVREVHLIEAMETRARADYSALLSKENPTIRATVLSRWLEVWTRKIEVLQGFGILPKTPEQLRVSLGEKDFLQMSPVELRLEEERVLQEIFALRSSRDRLKLTGTGAQETPPSGI